LKVGYERSFFSTRAGRIGLGPIYLQSGDQICIIHKGCTPYIVRPTSADPTLYELIGECYIDGLMYGEAFGLKESEKTETIVLV